MTLLPRPIENERLAQHDVSGVAWSGKSDAGAREESEASHPMSKQNPGLDWKLKTGVTGQTARLSLYLLIRTLSALFLLHVVKQLLPYRSFTSLFQLVHYST
jgi:hypothetical protein